MHTRFYEVHYYQNSFCTELSDYYFHSGDGVDYYTKRIDICVETDKYKKMIYVWCLPIYNTVDSADRVINCSKQVIITYVVERLNV